MLHPESIPLPRAGCGDGTPSRAGAVRNENLIPGKASTGFPPRLLLKTRCGRGVATAQSTSVLHTPVGLALCPCGTSTRLPAWPPRHPCDRQTDRLTHRQTDRCSGCSAGLGVSPRPAEENMPTMDRWEVGDLNPLSQH